MRYAAGRDVLLPVPGALSLLYWLGNACGYIVLIDLMQ